MLNGDDGVMIFDFSIVIKQITKVYAIYHNSDFYTLAWTLKDYIDVFTCFYETYKRKMYTDHPVLKTRHIAEIMSELPIIANTDFTPDQYIDRLIPRYFNTEFHNCNYSMLHFISGNIRMLRAYEEGLL